MKHKIPTPLLILVILFVATPTLRAQVSNQALHAALQQLHQQGMFNGVVLVAEQGNVIFHRSYGVSNIDTRAPLHAGSAFNLASVSKQFMAMMAMILSEQGKLRYDEPVQHYLPGFPYPDITIRQLLTHTSGLPEYFDLAQLYGPPLDTLTNTGLLALLTRVRPALQFNPGERWSYSNTGYAVLASVIEAVAGMPIDAFFQQTITGPLGLTNTAIYHLRLSHEPANRVFGFRRENGRTLPFDLTRFDGVVGDGNVYASAEDLLRWDQALYTEKLVKTTTLREAFTPVKLKNGTTYPYGFGWFIDSTGQVLSHTGSWTGFLNEIVRDTHKKQTLILLSSGGDGRARAVVKAILAEKTPNLPKITRIHNIRLIDGTGTPARKGAVRLRDNRIWEVGDLAPLPGETVVDGKGSVLAPGFIDSHSHHFGGLKATPEATALCTQGITTIAIGQDGWSYAMDSLEEAFRRHPVAVNVTTYAGHTTLREWVMGKDENMLRMATPEEVANMQKLLQRELDKGALGLSTGLEYEHAFFSNRSEVLALAKTTATAGGRYISHIRSEDIRLEDAVEEILQIGREAKLPVQISHIKIASRDQWGQASYWLAQLEQARAAGIDVTADCYPYDFWNSTLRVLFPNRDYTNPASAELAVTKLCDPEKSVLVRFAPEPSYAGKTLSAIAAQRRETLAQTLMYLVATADIYEKQHPDNDGVEAIMGKSMDEPDVEHFLAWPHTNICSDGAWGGHPRGHGAFTRVLGRYVRARRLMPLETAVYKMTGLSAQHLGLNDRGLITPGYFADLVLFNPATVSDRADIRQPKALSVGIEKVWVNGQLVYTGGQPTKIYPGVLVKRPVE